MEKQNRGAVTAAAAFVIVALLCAYNLRGGASDMTGGAVGTESAEAVMTSERVTESVTEPSETTAPETTEF